jgi:hypothetical protein
VISDLLVRGAVDAKAIEACFWGGIVKRRHVAAGRRRDVGSRVRLVLDCVRQYRFWLSKVEVQFSISRLVGMLSPC